MKTIKLYFTLIISMTTLSCDDYLERYPLDSPAAETFLRTEAELDLAVTGVYNSLWFKPIDNAPFTLSLDYASDIGWDRNGSALQELGKGIATPDNGYTKSFWDTFYRGIGRANYILSRAEPLAALVPAEKFKRQMAEIRFLRAYYYSYLNELFGGVPLLTEPTLLSESQIPRASKAEVTDFILSELAAVKQDLPLAIGTADKGRVSRGAVLALISRVALYNQKWEIAAQAGKELIDAKTYRLHANYGELFMYQGQNSPEIILAAQFLKGVAVHSAARLFYSRIALGHSNKIPVQALVDSYEATDGASIDDSPLFNPAKPFANRDPRLGYTVVLPQSVFIDYVFETHPDSLTTLNVATGKRVQNVEATHAYASFSGYLWRKYADAADKADRDNSELDIILFRYAEVLLNYAEAKIEANQIDQSVYDAINAVRTRLSVNMPPLTMGKSQAELRYAVRRERKYELAGEGFRLFDIRRWGIVAETMEGKLLGRIQNAFLSSAPRIDENATPTYNNVANADKMRVIEVRLFDKNRDLLWPIPRIELETNTALEQNPGY